MFVTPPPFCLPKSCHILSLSCLVLCCLVLSCPLSQLSLPTVLSLGILVDRQGSSRILTDRWGSPRFSFYIPMCWYIDVSLYIYDVLSRGGPAPRTASTRLPRDNTQGTRRRDHIICNTPQLRIRVRGESRPVASGESQVSRHPSDVYASRYSIVNY